VTNLPQFLSLYQSEGSSAAKDWTQKIIPPGMISREHIAVRNDEYAMPLRVSWPAIDREIHERHAHNRAP